MMTFMTCFTFTVAPSLLVDFQVNAFIDSVCEGRFDKVNSCQGMCVIQKSQAPADAKALTRELSVAQYPEVTLSSPSLQLALKESNLPWQDKIYQLTHLDIELVTPPPRA